MFLYNFRFRDTFAFLYVQFDEAFKKAKNAELMSDLPDSKACDQWMLELVVSFKCLY